MKLLLTLSLTFLVFFAPVPALAQDDVSPDGIYTGGGFVPCGQTAATPCNSCHIVILANTITKWLIGIAFMFFAVLAVIAGFKLVTAGGRPGALQDAKNSFTNAFIGLFIILGAWLLVDTLLRGILKGGDGELEGYGPWSEVKCATETIPGLSALNIDEDDFVALIQAEPEIGRNLYSLASNPGGNCTPAASGACSAASLSAFGGLAANAATILAAESRCNPNSESGTDRTTDGRTYSVGLWQINLTQHPLNCAGQSLNCPSAFRSTGQRHPKYKTRMYEVKDDALYKQCVALAKNPQCNSAKAAELVQRAGNFRDWACSAKKCGISTPMNHKCPVPSIR